MYDNGYGVSRDYNKALEYYNLSSSHGHVAATNNLGIMYHYGLGVKKNLNTACLLYKKAVDNGGSSISFDNLALCHERRLRDFKKDDAKAIEYYKKAIELGNEKSIYYLASLYDDMQDYEKSFALFKKASEARDKEVKRKGLYLVGTFYYLL
jgi:TPR repeat protein